MTRTTSFSRTQRRLALAAALAAVPAALVTTYAAAADSGAPVRDGSSGGLQLIEREGTFHFIDNPPRQGDDAVPSAGDQFVVVNKIFKGDKRIGSLHATCVVTRRVKDVEKVPLLCQGVFRLPGGDLAVTTLFRIGDTTTHIAITGGTGRYAGATGTATETTRPDGDQDLTIDLLS